MMLFVAWRKRGRTLAEQAAAKSLPDTDLPLTGAGLRLPPSQ
jgi:hypothetical protein